MADEKLEEMVAMLAVHCQRAEDRMSAAEDLFQNSLIIPASRLNAVLVTMILIVLFFVIGFCFVWWVDRPL